MPARKNFKHFKPCEICSDGMVGARTPKELENKKYCSNKCSASTRISDKTPEQKIKEQVERSYQMMNGNPEKYIKHLLQKPERKHLEVNQILSLLEKQGGKCALSGVDMTFTKIAGQPKVHTNLSIDRIDSSIGYEIDNIQLVTSVVNIMKTTLSVEELQWWCGKIIDNSKEVICHA